MRDGWSCAFFSLRCVTTRGLDRRFPYPINQMKHCQYGMLVDHPGACVSHHHTNLLSHRGLVAMDRALGARRFPCLVRALVETLPSIIQKFIALRTKPFGSVM